MLWWTDCSSGRRVNQTPCREYHRRTRENCGHSESEESENELDLQQWDNWFHGDDEKSTSSASSGSQQ